MTRVHVHTVRCDSSNCPTSEGPEAQLRYFITHGWSAMACPLLQRSADLTDRCVRPPPLEWLSPSAAASSGPGIGRPDLGLALCGLDDGH